MTKVVTTSAEWAFAIVLSRTFEARVLLGDAGEGIESAMIMMLPFADMVNHSPHHQVRGPKHPNPAVTQNLSDPVASSPEAALQTP